MGYTEPGSRGPGGPVSPWLAAGAAVILSGLVLVVVNGDDREAVVPATSEIPAPTTAVPPEVGVALTALDTWNSGDLDAWLSHWAAPPSDGDVLMDAIWMNANQQINAVQPCDVTSREAGGTHVTCPVVVTDDFWGAGGITSAATVRFSIDDAGLIVSMNDSIFEDPPGNCCPPMQEFDRAFYAWLEEAHPDVFAQIAPPPGERWRIPGFLADDATHMFIALEYVEEFVAESPDYPIDSAGP